MSDFEFLLFSLREREVYSTAEDAKCVCMLIVRQQFIKFCFLGRSYRNHGLLGQELCFLLLKFLLRITSIEHPKNWLEDFVQNYLVERINLSSDGLWRVLTKLACSKTQAWLFTTMSNEAAWAHFKREICAVGFGDQLTEVKSRTKYLFKQDKWVKLLDFAC